MFDHIGLRVKDVAKSARFYEAVLAPLGYVVDASGTGFGPPGAPVLWLYETTGATSSGATVDVRFGAHVAFRAPGRSAVDLFHREGLAAGASDHGRPGLRADYGPAYYAAFLVDPDGNNVEAVCLDEER